MAVTESRGMWYGALGLVAVGAVVFAIRLQTGPIHQSRKVFTGLVKGRYAVHQAIDWAHLKALDVNVGEEYTKLPDDAQRVEYRQAFISQFARGFQTMGGRLSDFTHWRREPSPDGRTLVAVDYPAKQKTLLFELSAQGTVAGIRWK